MSSVSTGYLVNLIEGSIALGASESAVLAHIPGGREALSDEHARFPAGLAVRVLNTAAESSGIDAIGLRIGLQFRPATVREVGYALAAASSLREAIEINIRYQALNQEVVRTHLEVNGGRARIVLTPAIANPETTRRVTEAILAGYASMGRWLMWDEARPPAEIQFRHARPGDDTCAAYRAILGEVVEFGAPVDAMTIDASLIARALPNANPELLELLRSRLDARLAAYKADSALRLLVKTSLHKQIRNGKPSLDETARLIGMSGRSLRRRLMDEGLTYSDLLTEARKEAADVYIQDDALSLAEIAGLLGYVDQTAFIRAFRGWFGDSPGAYRDQRRKAAP